jgi:TPR repeat protein
MPYIKACNLPANYTRYIATRNSVDKDINLSQPYGKPTDKQIKFINKLIESYPQAVESFEYDDYINNPIRETASKFITAVAEQNPEFFSNKQMYVNYIATRPRAQKLCDHGLFGMNDSPLQLEKVKTEIKNHKGNVWIPIISLRREDAKRLGYDNAKAWKILLQTKQADFAKCLGIPISDLKMYAAYHDEGHHPHIHMLVYSTNPKNEYVTKKGIETLKSAIARDIFKLELYDLYNEKTITREKVADEINEKTFNLVQEINQKNYSDSIICSKLLLLSDALKNTKGKKVYGYLRPEVKAIVDDIIQEMASDKTVNELYKAWGNIQNQILGIYKSNFPKHPPLWENKEFKKIKNAIIVEALKISNKKGFIIPEYIESEPVAKNSKHFLLSANQKNHYAQYEAAELFYRGKGIGIDIDRANSLYQQALHGFIEMERQSQNSNLQLRIAKMYELGLGTNHDMKCAIEYYEKAASHGNSYAELKLAKIYFDGKGVDYDKEKAMAYLERAIEHGNEYAVEFKAYILRQPSLAQSALYLFARLADMMQSDIENTIRKHNQGMVDRKVMIEILKKKQEQGMKF